MDRQLQDKLARSSANIVRAVIPKRITKYHKSDGNSVSLRADPTFRSPSAVTRSAGHMILEWPETIGVIIRGRHGTTFVHSGRHGTVVKHHGIKSYSFHGYPISVV